MRKVLFFVCIVLLAGCASKKGGEFESNMANKSRVYQLNSIGSISGIQIGDQPIKGELDAGDDLIQLGAYKSSFDVYKFNGRAGAHRIRLKTFCDCFGFSKDMIQPEVIVLDKNNAKIDVSVINVKRVQPHLGALYVEYLYEFALVGVGERRIILTSKNDRLGTEVVRTEVTAEIITGSPFSMAIQAAPYGKYEIAIK